MPIFDCTFCFWGQGFAENKVRHRSAAYVRAEAEWVGRNKCKYIFLSDANFGMFPRDQEVARIYAETKARWGYPERIRVCYGKNKEENVFKTALILHEAGMAKAVTLARQSNSPEALANIRRSNIKLDVYSRLQERYLEKGIPTYTELILGLPGETAASFKAGVEDILGTATQLFIYHCSVLPNTPMAEPAYLKAHDIRTVRVPLAEVHGAVRDPAHVVEYEDIVISTNTMTVREWKECAVFAWEAQLRQSFGVEEVPQWVTDWFWVVAESVVAGESRAQVDPRFGNLYWEPEELAYLLLALERGEARPDSETFAREAVLYGRKSRVHHPPLGT